MNRPMMDPTFVPDVIEAKRRHVPIGKWLGKAGKWFFNWLLSNPLAIRKPGDEPVRFPVVKVAVRMVVFWSILLPLMLASVVVLTVYMGTHPTPQPIVAEPSSQGVYFEPTTLKSTDGTELAGWLIPAIDARRVVEEKDHALRLSHPGVVLVHDYGHTMQQMLPLVKPLHDEGIEVLVLGLRGSGTGSNGAQTFGLNESKDVMAAVDLMRQTAFVDGNRIAVIGVGTGANAALIAASRANNVRALVLADMLVNSNGIVAARLTPSEPWLAWLRPLCRRVFEFQCGVDTEDLNQARYNGFLKSRPVLMLPGQEGITTADTTTLNRIKLFCRKQLDTQQMPVKLGSAR